MLLTERYQEKIAGVLSCYDRIIIQGTILVYCLSNIFTIAFACAILGACGNQPISS